MKDAEGGWDLPEDVGRGGGDLVLVGALLRCTGP